MVVMTADRAGYLPSDRVEILEEQLKGTGAWPIQPVPDLACPDPFESDQELEDVLTFTYMSRRAGRTFGAIAAGR